MRSIFRAGAALLLAALAGRLPAQCMDIELPDTLSYTVQVEEISLDQPVDRKFWFTATNGNIQDELLTLTLRKLSGPPVGEWRYQICEDPSSDPHSFCRPINPWETEFTIVDTLYSEDWSLYDAEIYATTYGAAELELILSREFCPEEEIQLLLSLTVEPANELAADPAAPALAAAWPNPFNPLAHIPFVLERPGAVRVEVLDLAGRLVAVPLQGSLPPGRHEALFDGSGLPSGRYHYRVITEDHILSAPLTLIK